MRISDWSSDVYSSDLAIDSGRAAERFGAMVAALGGPTDFLERAHDLLPRAPIRRPVQAKAAGVLSACDTRAVGLAVIALGGGRHTRTRRIKLRRDRKSTRLNSSH